MGCRIRHSSGDRRVVASSARYWSEALAGVILILAAVISAIPIRTGTAMAAPPSEAEISSIQKARVPAGRIDLPDRAGSWERGAQITHDAETIFDYMDGAAEIYLGYRFDRLDVVEYVSAQDEPIVVELYSMGSSDDAYGLMSLDGSGASVTLTTIPEGASKDDDAGIGKDAGVETSVAGVPGGSPRHATYPGARYSGGLVRVWSGPLYVRIVARHETDASRDAALEIARAIVADRAPNVPPALVSGLPRTLTGGLHLSEAPPCFVRSHLVLNSVRFLADDNIFSLGADTEAVLARYEEPIDGREIEVLVVRYPGPDAADDVRRRFAGQATWGTGNDRDPLTRGSAPMTLGRTLVGILGSPANDGDDALADEVATAIEGVSR